MSPMASLIQSSVRSWIRVPCILFLATVMVRHMKKVKDKPNGARLHVPYMYIYPDRLHVLYMYIYPDRLQLVGKKKKKVLRT